MAEQQGILGYGILTPFRRGANDFMNGGGTQKVEGSVALILGIRCSGPNNSGEIPFNQRLGTLVESIRLSNMDDPTTQDLARFYIIEALKRNEPRIIVNRVSFELDHNRYLSKIKLVYNIIDHNVPGNRVLVRDVTQEVSV